MRRMVLMLVAVLMLPGLADAQDSARRRMQRDMMQSERQLEQRIRERFMGMAAQRMALDSVQRVRLREVLREGAEGRLELARQSRELRVLLMEAVNDGGTSAATYESLVRQMRELGEAEHALEQRELDRLGEFLDPRQQAVFLAMRMRFNEQVQRLRGPGPG